jgi:kinesin family protein 6/9
MAYGQTGAGKTFTMTGATENYKHRGIIPRAISQIFREIAERPQLAITVRFSYLEIYNEVIVDLLSSLRVNEGPRHLQQYTGGAASNLEGNNGSAGALLMQPGGLTVIDDKHGNVQVKDLTVLIGNHEEEALNFLFEGETNRSISTHSMNKNSSRSHCIFTIYLESRSRVESSEKVIYSKLNLVDLAGSERLSKTNSRGTTLREAMCTLLMLSLSSYHLRLTPRYKQVTNILGTSYYCTLRQEEVF